MPMWSGYWGGPWGGFGWIFPLLGLTFMVVMVLYCMRRMGGMSHCGGAPGHGQAAHSDIEALRREIQDLREEVRTLHARV